MTKKFTWGCIFVLISCATAKPQQSHIPGVIRTAKLTGKVMDAVDRTPLVGALVTVGNPAASDLKDLKVAISAQDGSYIVTGLVSKKQYRVTYSKEEYAPDERLVTVSTTQDGT